MKEKRLSFVIPDELDALLESERRRRDVPASVVIREALVAYLVGDASEHALPFVALGRSGHHDTARWIDEILAEEWDADRRR
jgi:hypothetical protein